MPGARRIAALVAVPLVLLGCTGDPQPSGATAVPTAPAASEAPVQAPTAEPLGQPEPRGELSRYLQGMRHLGFRCETVEAMACRRLVGSIEYSVDIAFTPDGWVDGLRIEARAQDPVSDLRTEARSIAVQMGAIARPLLDGPAELADVQAYLEEHLAAAGNGESTELGRITIGIGSADFHEREGGMVSAHLRFTDVVGPETP